MGGAIPDPSAQGGSAGEVHAPGVSQMGEQQLGEAVVRLRPSAHLLTAGAAPHAGSGNVSPARRSRAYWLQPRWRRLASITASPHPPGSSSGSPGRTWKGPRGRSP